MKDKKVLGVILILLILSISVTGFSMGKDITDIDRVAIVANSNTNKREVTNVRISLNGNPLNIPKEYGAPFIDNQSRTMIPLRIIGERLGHEVGWDNSTRTASIDGKVFITIGQKVVKTPNGDVQMDTVAILKDDGRTYVPLRFVVEALGYEVSYDGPKHSNNYNHMVDIYKEGMILPTEPVQEGNVHKIITESGVVEFNPEVDTYDWYGSKHLKDEKAYEIMKAYHDSFVYDEHSDYVTLSFFEPKLPEGMSFVTIVEVVTKQGQYNTIYRPDSTDRYVTSRNGEKVNVKFSTVGENFSVKDIEKVLILSQIKYNGVNSVDYREEMKTGRVAKLNEFLFTEEEIDRVEDFYLPKYRK